MDTLLIIYVFMLGAAFGSFALVLADRMHTGRDWVKGRSACDHCGHKLGPADLVPLISWTLQNGKCRHCSKRISVFYPLVELGLALAFVGSYILLPYDISGLNIARFVLWLLGLVIMTALVVSDLKWYLLPSRLVYPLVGLSSAHVALSYYTSNQSTLNFGLNMLVSLAIGSGLFWLLYQMSSGKWIGDGDYRLGVAMALFLGNPFHVWMSLFFASVLGLAVSVPVIVRAKDKLKVKIPFGPFLIMGLLLAYLFGERIVDWYSSAFLFL